MAEAGKQANAVARFRELHQSGCFILPNPWDLGSAVYLERLGFRALATTSAGVAFSRGRPDTTPALPLEEMLEHVREISAVTTLPVNTDFQNGYADEPAAVADNVKRCLATGAAGLSIEDNPGHGNLPLYPKELAVERICAARRAIDDSGIPVVLTGRCETGLVGESDPLGTALDRLVAYAEAGADCLYAPGVSALAEIKQIVEAVAPKPVNVLAADDMTFARLTDLGVRRISIGSSFARVAYGAFIRAAREIQETGAFESLAGGVPFGEINAIFQAGSK